MEKTILNFTKNLKEKSIKWESVQMIVCDSQLKISSDFFFNLEDLAVIFSELRNNSNTNLYLDNSNWKIVFTNNKSPISNEILDSYTKFLSLNSFIWKNDRELGDIFSKRELFSNLKIDNANRIYFQNLPLGTDQDSLNKKILILEKYLVKMGLDEIDSPVSTKFSTINNPSNIKKGGESIFNNQQQKQQSTKEFEKKESMKELEDNKFNLENIKNKWKNENLKLIEFSVHTKFSTLDGVSSPLDFINCSKKKDYKALAFTDHKNVQAFPEIWESRTKNEELQIVYGCEFEVVDSKIPQYLLVRDENQANKIQKEIDELVYCIFDVETTGLYSAHDEIIDFGYVIFKGKEIIEQKNYLIKPKKEVSSIIYQITNIKKEELDNSQTLEEILPIVRNSWEENGVDVVVAHNAAKFDLPFLSKAWKEVFNEQVPYPFIDTIPLSWIAFPNKKSYSLEKLSQGKIKVEQAHRALEDSLLLKNLFDRIIKIAKEKEFKKWEEFSSMVVEGKPYNRGTRVVALAKNQAGITSLYELVKISHVDNFFKSPILSRSDIENHRKNLFIGASANPDSEIFTSFNSFSDNGNIEEKMKFYDYIEVRGMDCFTHYTNNSFRIQQKDLEKSIYSIINTAKKLGIKAIATNNVHYSEKYQNKLKEIIVANEGMNGSRHHLYSFIFNDNGFQNLPAEHLRSIDEVAESWSFLKNEQLIEEIVFKNPENLLKDIENVKIFDKHIGYQSTGNNENELILFCSRRASEIFGGKIPSFVTKRIQREWKTIKGSYLAVYWLSWKAVEKAHSDGSIVGSRGSVGCSLIAYLLNITDINPLPLYTICRNCKYYKAVPKDKKVGNPSCYDFEYEENCKICGQGTLKYEGHSLPFETFVGWSGEKTPDIDLNFSGEYQHIAHNYIKELLGKENVFRIGTINKLSQQTAEKFWDEYQKLRKNLDKNFNLRLWLNEVSEETKINDLKDLKEFMIESLKGIKRTTGQHPGGLLVIPPDVKILEHTPLNYPADDPKSEWLTTHFEYSFLSNIFLKLDILGHDEPTILQKFFSLTGKDPLNEKDISFNDKKIMDVFTNCDTLGIPEFGTDLVKKSLLEPIRPTKFSQLVQISGFSHGTDVWLQNQQKIYKEGKLSLEKLLACREDILNMLDNKGVDKKNAFDATEYIRKGKWNKLDQETKDVIKSKLTDEEGEFYFSILEKIKYIFPKPHAIAYTMTAWRTAYYKVYFPKVFYSILLTYHATVYDIWLMTFDTEKSIPFRLNKLIDNLGLFKVSSKEFISISKVLLKLAKEESEISEFTEIVYGNNRNYYEVLKINKEEFSQEELDRNYQSLIDELNNSSDPSKKINSRAKDKNQEYLNYIKKAYETITNNKQKIIYDEQLELNKRIKDNFSQRDLNDWKLTAKEKDLLFTMRVVSEIKKKGFEFSIGVDFNQSDLNDFKFENNRMLIPFSAIPGFGEAVAKKIYDYRNNNLKITNWKEDLKDLLNKKHLEQLVDFEENNLIFNGNCT